MALKPFDAGAGKTVSTGNKPPVLYVEDEDPNWDVASATLSRSYEMHRARTSQEAFEELGKRQHRVILMDIQLANSEHNGIQICKILTQRFVGDIPENAKAHVGKAPPIIFVTAYTSRYRRDEVVGFGGEDLISKPIDFLKLTSAITRILLRPVHNLRGAS